VLRPILMLDEDGVRPPAGSPIDDRSLDARSR
jgi:hypothetical protein